MKIFGNIIDLEKKHSFYGYIIIRNNIIVECVDISEWRIGKQIILPGFVDSHVHIESSMLSPSSFSTVAIPHGTVGVVADPHEIANVCGVDGIEFMIDNASEAKLKISYSVPSCVPATEFDSSGADITKDQVEKLFQSDRFVALAEMMNYPGVINSHEEVIAKINSAKRRGLPIDGHAPGLSGEELSKYIASGIGTDHECSTYQEAVEKINEGQKILIREGSSAKNYEALKQLIPHYADSVMFCTDDSHPKDLEAGYLKSIVKRALDDGFNMYDVLRASSYNAVKFYNLNIGLLQPGDSADFIIIDGFEQFNVLGNYIDGTDCLMVNNNEISDKPNVIINNFNRLSLCIDNIKISPKKSNIRVICLEDGSLETKIKIENAKILNGNVVSDIEKDVLKVVVVNRYNNNSTPSIGFVNGMGFKKGAVATTIAHDSHNIIAVGADDNSILEAINEIIKLKGGLSVVNNDVYSMGLEIGGLMTHRSCSRVAKEYSNLLSVAKLMGCQLISPFLTLSFMSLLVIPDYKISDKGLFDVKRFKFIDLFV